MIASDELLEKIVALPHSPGVYQYFDRKGQIIYVGKAKNLKKRVSSYFQIKSNFPKTQVLVSKICNLQYIVVESEHSALLLENSLIKKYQPKYNILLKDDKSYPWICISRERFPRVFLTRVVDKSLGTFFGPYTKMSIANGLLELLQDLYPIRSCSFELSEKKVIEKKYILCLDYHLKKCCGPCQGYQTETDYNENIKRVKNILKGNISQALRYFQEQMQQYANQLDFEKAQEQKSKINLLYQYQVKSTVVNNSIKETEVFNIQEDIDYLFYNYLKIHNGSIIQAYTSELKKKVDEPIYDLLASIILETREFFQSKATEIIVPFEVPFLEKTLKQTIPQTGDKKKLLELSLHNVIVYRSTFFKQQSQKNPEIHTDRILNCMKKDLQMSVLPKYIECFDNSTLQGQHTASACVVFRDGKPSKKEYRHFSLQTITQTDDYASMAEVIQRRYERLLNEKKDLPNLIIIDGGKGQLQVVCKVLKILGIFEKLTVISIAKRLEEIYSPTEDIPLYLDKTSETLKIIQKARDEAHRFCLRHHKQLRTNFTLHSTLEQIEGLGPQSIQKLLLVFGSVQRIKEANILQLNQVVGKYKAQKIYDFLNIK